MNPEKHKKDEFIFIISDFNRFMISKNKGLGLEALVNYTYREGSRIAPDKEISIKKAVKNCPLRIYHVKKRFELLTKEELLVKYSSRSNNDSETVYVHKNNPSNNEITISYKENGKKCETIKKEFEVLEFLLKNGFLRKFETDKKFKNLRLDLSRIINDLFYFTECKNRGKTGLSSRDLKQLISYGIAIKEAIPIGHINLVYNGSSRISNKDIWRMEKKHGLKIKLHYIKDWLDYFGWKHGKKIDYMIITKLKINAENIEMICLGKKSKRVLYINISEYNPDKSYAAIPMIISDNLNFIKHELSKIGRMNDENEL
ncbi:hypothetical protein HYW20_08045 [Candidatus Woesearchaeota archaeon]|nr:hypothetical protein [Candidatus Woesearchaeota archaeon]